MCKQFEMLRLLVICSEVDVNIQNDKGDTPLVSPIFFSHMTNFSILHAEMNNRSLYSYYSNPEMQK